MNVVFRNLAREEIADLMSRTKDFGERRLVTAPDEDSMLGPMGNMLLGLMFAQWRRLLDQGQYEAVRKELDEAIETLKNE